MNHISSSLAFILTLLSLLSAFILRTFYPSAPFEMFATTVGAVFGAYITKRVIQKQAKFQPNGGNEVKDEMD